MPFDAVIDRIATYASNFRVSDVPGSTIHDGVRRVVDSIGCALGGYGAVPPTIARKMALRANDARGARVWGTKTRALPELAAFANSAAIRYLDANDAYPGTGGHPSDMLGGIIAAAETAGAGGPQLMAAITLGYEVYHEFRQAKLITHAGLDSAMYSQLGSSVAAAFLFELDYKGIANALSLAATPNVPLEVTRRGALAMWKGVAGANAARNGVFSALLAREGLEGPEAAIDGKNGFRDMVEGFDREPFAHAPDYFHITETNLKSFSSCYHAQSPISAALELVPNLTVSDIESIAVTTHAVAWDKVGRDPEKWHPTNRETADHSMPYVIAASLVNGRFEGDMFAAEYLADPRIHQLMSKITVAPDDAMTGEFPERAPCRIEITTPAGTTAARVDYSRGHYKNPMSDEAVNAKFTTLAVPVIGEARVRALLDLAWNVAQAPSFEPLFDALVM